MKLTNDELSALTYLAGYGSVATHWIAKHLGWGVDTSRAYRMLVRLADKRGLVERVTASGRTYGWRISSAGRAALAENSNG